VRLWSILKHKDKVIDELRARIAELEVAVKEAAPIMYSHGFWKGVSPPQTEQMGEQDK